MSPAAISRLEQVLFAPPPAGDAFDLYAVLDGAAVRKLPDMFEKHGAPHGCLFRGETEPAILVRAPWLVQLTPGSPVLEWLIHEGWGRNWGIYALVPPGTPFPDVLGHFRQFVQVALPDGRIVFFRFHDPRILRLFLPTCDNGQNAELFAIPRYLASESADGDSLLLFSSSDGNPASRAIDLHTPA